MSADNILFMQLEEWISIFEQIISITVRLKVTDF